MSKRPLSAYNYFTKDQETRSKIKTENPDWNNSQIMAHLGELWRDLSDEDKKPYQELSKQAKDSWVEPVEEEPEEPINTRPKKAKSPYFQYLYDPDIRKPMVTEHPDWKPKQLTTAIAVQWNKLSDTEKQPWVDKMEAEKEELLNSPILIEVKRKNGPESLEGRVKSLEKELSKLRKIIEELLEKK